jgi:uncharacterized protein (TIGR02217 family)
VTYLTTQFPVGISLGATGGPGWRSTEVETAGGYRYTNQSSDQALCRYDVSHAARTAAQYATLLAFFRACRGPLHSFPFKDWTDYVVASGEGKFVLLTSTTFQMIRRYTTDSTNHDRTILKPVSGTIAVVGGVAPVVDYVTGIVTVSSGTPTSWTGEFNVPCKFDMGDMSGDIIVGPPTRFMFGWSGIKIVETRNP